MELKRRYYLLLIIFSFLTYLNSIFNPFIWDDLFLIFENPYIKNFKLSFQYFYKDIYLGPSNFYRPLQMITYAFIYKIFKLNPISYHLINIFFHIGCSLLFFLLLKEIYGEKISFLVSLLWAIHPINTEAITYISGTADPLFLFFGLLGIYFYFFYLYNIPFPFSAKNRVGQVRGEDKGEVIYLTFSYLCFIFSLLSKETGILILPLFFLYLYSINRIKKQEIKNYVGITLIFVIYFILRQTILKFEKGQVEEIFIYRFFTSFKCFLIYLSLLLFPFILSVERHILYIKTFKNLDFIVGFIYFLLFILFLYKKRQDKKILFAGALFILNFLFHSNIFIPLNGNLREHWMYPGGIGFFIYFVMLIDMIKKKNFKTGIIILIFSLYGIRTILRNYDWKDPEKFYLKSLTYSYYPSLLYGNLSYHYFRNGEYKKGLVTSQKAISLGLKNETIFYIYGVSLSKLGEYNSAIEVFNYVLKKNPQNYEILTELGEIYFLKGEIALAEKFLNRSLEINNLYPKTYYVLIEVNRLKGNKEKIINYIQKLTYITPDDFYPYYLKGLYYKEIGDFKKAKEEFYKSYLILSKKKKDFYSTFNLGILMKEMGMLDNALNLFLKLQKENPENIEIINEIAICYAVKGDKMKAKELWEKILEKKPDYYPAIENLKRLKF